MRGDVERDRTEPERTRLDTDTDVNTDVDTATSDTQTDVDDETEQREPVSGAPRATNAEEDAAQLFNPAAVERFRVQWQEIQARFIDDPRQAVQGADQLVASVMRSLASTFSDHKHQLESQWQQDSPETEDLRIALRRYRSFFNQLLNA